MNIKELILKELKTKKEVTVNRIKQKTGFSQPYIHRYFRELEDEGRITRVGEARSSKYVAAEKKKISDAKSKILSWSSLLKNDAGTKIDEHTVLNKIKRKTGIFTGLRENISSVLDYAFTEILNNAIEHSRSRNIQLKMRRDGEGVTFTIADNGIGIFNNIKQKFGLAGDLDAVDYLIKGKQTTSPKEHSGEGIFFTSKVCDNLIIQSSTKRLIFNNILEDVFIRNFHETKGTRVTFYISLKSKKELTSVFNRYTDDEYEFSKTNVTVMLFKTGNEYISRSQARRITAGLDKFKSVILDFKGVDTVGQGFADEIFRVWKNNHPRINIETVNENENVGFMIKRAIAAREKSEPLPPT